MKIYPAVLSCLKNHPGSGDGYTPFRNVPSMAFRSWVKLLGTTVGVAALAGACQLGLAYGLGIVWLTRVVDVTARDQWTAQLAWITWIAMVAAVVGALVGSRLLAAWGLAAESSPPTPVGDSAPRPPAPPVPSAGTIIALAVASGIGAAVVVPLTMQPARTAQVAGVNPVVVIGICATLGAVVGIFAACAALAQPVARWNLVAVSIAVWAIAIVSVAPSDPLPAVRLGVFDASFLSSSTTQRTALFTMPVLALLAGAALGWRARRQERPVLTIALTGLPGPALLTLAYLIAGPGSGDERYQIVPYWAAMTATGAGVLGSVLAAVLRRGGGADEPVETPDGEEAVEGLPSLPRRPNEPTSEIARAAEAPTQFTPSARQGTSSSAPAGPSASGGSNRPGPAGSAPGDDPRAGTLRPSDTAVFDAPTGQIRPAPGSGGPLAAPWSPTAGGVSVPLASPAPQFSGGRETSTLDAVRASERPGPTVGRSSTTPAPGPGGVALGEYAGPEPKVFDGFARGEATHGRPLHSPGQHATPEHAGSPDRFTPPGTAPGWSAPSGDAPGWSSPTGDASGWASPGGQASGWSSSGGLNLDLTAPGRPAADHTRPDQARPGHAKPYVPEPATRPLPPEVLGQPAPPPPTRVGVLGRGLRSLGRGRTGGASMDLPLSGPTAHAGQDRPTIGAHAQPEPKSEPTNRRRSRRAPLVPEPHAVSAPLPQPTPISPPLPHPQPVTQPRQSGPPLTPPRQSGPPLTPPRQSGPPPTMPDSQPAPTVLDGRHGPTTPDSRHGDATPAGFGKPRRGEAPRVAAAEPPTTSAGANGQHAVEPAKASDDDRTGDAGAAGGSGRRSRFGLKKRKDNSDYVDWVSGLGNDAS